jgi:transmembrane sensor
MKREHESAPIASRLGPALDEEGVARTWRRIQSARAASRPRTGVTIRVFAGLAAAAALALGVWSLRGDGPARAPGALAVSGTALAPGEAVRAASVSLDDGSRLALAQATDLEVLANDGTRFDTLLRRGRCRFDVEPGGPRRWSIETDLATVEVVGTAFTVTRDDAGLAVEVDHGIVLVRGERVPGRVQRLRAGQRLAVSAATAPVAIAAPPHPAPPDTAVPAANAPARALAPSPEPATLTPAPRPTTPTIGTNRTVDEPQTVDVQTRLQEADAARAAGRPEIAAALLERALREGGDATQRAIAAFSLGRLELEVLDRPAAAAERFAAVVAHGAPRALVEDAQARRVEALVRAGSRDEAEREATVYETRWPSGRRLSQVRAWVTPPAP